MPDTPVGDGTANYLLTSADLGATVYCKVTATNASGTANADSNTVGPVTAGVGGWTPADLTGLLAWYKADAGVYIDLGTTAPTDGQRFKQWNDQSGNGRHMTHSGPIDPDPITGTGLFYRANGFGSGKPAIECDYEGNLGIATAVDTVSQGGGPLLSVFVVCQLGTIASGDSRIVSYYGNGEIADYADPGSTIAMMVSTAGTLSAYRVGILGATTTYTAATKYRFGSIFNGTNHEIYKNNVATGSPVAATGVFSSPGQIGFLNSISAVGFFAEIVVTNTALDGSTRTQLDDYFKAKWGLT